MTATVHNKGRAATSTELPLVVDGSRVDTRTVELGPGERTEVTYEFPADEPGQHRIAVGNTTVQSLTVESQSTATDTSETGESGHAENGSDETDDATESGGSGATGPGFGTGLALVALVVGSLALAARRAR